MKKVILLFLALILGVGLVIILLPKKQEVIAPTNTQQPTIVPTEISAENPITTIAENLDTPWGLVFLSNKTILVTERPGRVQLVENGKTNLVANLGQVREISEGGLLGIDIHPEFEKNNFVYLYYTYSGDSNQTLNRVVRMTYKNKTLIGEKIIVDRIPGAPNHNGGRIKFGPDKNLYIATGDAQNPSQSQDKNSLAGKILRVTDEGKVSNGNPFNNLVYSYGHRNPQGLAWDKDGKIWSTEHGQSRLDELNLIEIGKNYGWPTIQGNETRAEMETPRLNSGSDTWAPAGVAFKGDALQGDALFFGGLKGQALYKARLAARQAIMNGDEISLKTHFKGEFGRIRDVVLGPDNMLYITTSNRDGRGNPKPSDDKIIKINPERL